MLFHGYLLGKVALRSFLVSNLPTNLPVICPKLFVVYEDLVMLVFRKHRAC